MRVFELSVLIWLTHLSSSHENMYLLDCPFKYVVIPFTINLFITRIIECPQADSRDVYKTRRFKDIKGALNYLHQCFPEQTPMEEKCRRYAVIVSMTASTGRPYESTVSIIATLDKDSFDEHYRNVDIGSLSSLIMAAIDKYRTSMLAAPFLDLIECLRMLDSPIIKQYLENSELQLIQNLYKQVLESPDTVIDFDSIDFGKFHPAFETALRNLLDPNLNRTFEQEVVPKVEKRRRTKKMPLELADPPERQREDEARLQKQKRVEKRLLLRRRHLHRTREWERLIKQRLRLLEPDRLREKERVRKQRRRARIGVQRGQKDPKQELLRTPAWTTQAHMPFGPRPIYMLDVPDEERRQLRIKQRKQQELRQLQLQQEQNQHIRQHKLQVNKIQKLQFQCDKESTKGSREQRRHEGVIPRLWRPQELVKQWQQSSFISEMKRQYEEHHSKLQRDGQSESRERHSPSFRWKEPEPPNASQMMPFGEPMDQYLELGGPSNLNDPPAFFIDIAMPDQAPAMQETQEAHRVLDHVLESNQNWPIEAEPSFRWSPEIGAPPAGPVELLVEPMTTFARLSEHIEDRQASCSSSLPGPSRSEHEMHNEDIFGANTARNNVFQSDISARNGSVSDLNYIGDARALEGERSQYNSTDQLGAGENFDTFSDLMTWPSQFNDLDEVLQELIDDEPDTR